MKHALTMLLAYAAWVVACVGGIINLLLLRAAIDQVYILARLPRNVFRFVDWGSMFALGAVLLFLIILGESYFRDGVERGDLNRRMTKVFGIEVIAAFVLYLIPHLAAML